jgi:hypothetical protein
MDFHVRSTHKFLRLSGLSIHIWSRNATARLFLLKKTKIRGAKTIKIPVPLTPKLSIHD